MGGGFDGLIDYLLEEIAICGEQGASVRDVLENIHDYYKKQDGSEVGAFAVDGPFLRQIWQWLTENPDIRIGLDGRGKSMTLDEVQAFNQSITPSASLQQGSSNVSKSQAATLPDGTGQPASSVAARQTAPPPKGTKSIGKASDSTELRAYAAEERMWYAITGHSPNPEAVPPSYFQCLSFIAATREQGITQPDLVRISGQDKRSVPKRTDTLQQKGYIVKSMIFHEGHRTSHCLLKRFATSEHILQKPGSAVHRNILQVEPASAISKSVYNVMMTMQPTFDKMFELLRECPVYAWYDLKRDLGYTEGGIHHKVLANFVRRWEVFGCLKRDETHPMNVTNIKRKTEVRKSVALVREPTEEDWARHRSYEAESSLQAERRRAFLAASGSPIEDMDDGNGSDDDKDEEVAEEAYPAPFWDLETPLPNFVHDIILDAGSDGISTMQLRDMAFGQFFDRPIDHFLSNMQDNWQDSQPAHLRHLSLLKDFAYNHRVPHYVHYTYETFERRVNAGQASWEAVETLKPSKGSKSKNEASRFTPADLDEYGFPKLDKKDFVGSENSASLAECLKASAFAPSRVKYVQGPSAKAKEVKTLDNESTAPEVSPRITKPKIPRREPMTSTGSVPILDSPKPTAKFEARGGWKRKTPRTWLDYFPSKSAHKPQSPGLVALYHSQAREVISNSIQRPSTVAQHVPLIENSLAAVRESLTRAPKMTRISPPVPPTTAITYFPSVFSHFKQVIHPPKKFGRPAKRRQPMLPWYITPAVKEWRANVINARKASKQAKKPAIIEPSMAQDVVETTISGPSPLRSILPRSRKRTAKAAGLDDDECSSPQKKANDISTTQDDGEYIAALSSTSPALPVGNSDVTTSIHEHEAVITDVEQEQIVQPLSSTIPMAIARPRAPLIGMTHEQQSDVLTRTKPGCHIGNLALLARPGVRGLRPKSQLAIFKTDTLWQLDWFGKKPTAPDVVISDDNTDGIITTSRAERDPVLTEQSPNKRKLDEVDMDYGSPRKKQRTSVTFEIVKDPTQHEQHPLSTRAQPSIIEPELDLANDNSLIDHTSKTQTGNPGNFGTPTTPRRRKSVRTPVNRIRGSMNILRRKIILDILQQAGGLYPAERELWFPFVSAWVPQTNTGKPDQRTIDLAKKSLLDDGSIRQVRFSYRSKRGTLATRAIITLPDISPSDPRVFELEEHMKRREPNLYFPPKPEIAAGLKRDLPVDEVLTTLKNGAKMSTQQELDEKEEMLQAEIQEQRETHGNAALRKQKRRLDIENARAERKMHRERAEAARKKQLEVIRAQLQKALEEELREPDFVIEGYKASSVVLPSEKAGAHIIHLQQDEPGNANYFEVHPLAQPSLERLSNTPHPVLTRARSSRVVQQGVSVNVNLQQDETNQADYFAINDGKQPSPIRMSIIPQPASTRTRNQRTTQQSLNVKKPKKSRPKDLKEILSEDIRYRARLPRSDITSMDRFSQEINKVLYWELDTKLLEAAGGDDWYFVNHPYRGDHVGTQESHTDTLQWMTPYVVNTNGLLTQETWIYLRNLKYEDMLRDGQPPRFIQRLEKQMTAEVPPQKPRERRRAPIPVTGRVSRLKSLKDKHMPGQSASKKNAVITSSDIKHTRVVRDKRVRNLESGEERQLLVSYIAVRTLVGGLDRVIDWGLLASIYEGTYDETFIHKKWSTIRQKYLQQLPKLETDFQELILAAYEEDAIPLIDYDNVRDYDWKGLIDWTLRTLDTAPPQDLPELPLSQDHLDKFYSLDLWVGAEHDNLADYYELNGPTTIPRRHQLVHTLPAVHSVPFRKPKPSSTDMTLARSWVKSNIATPETSYDTGIARTHLSQLPEETIASAVNELLGTKVLAQQNKGRLVPGRNYDFSEHFLNRLGRNISVRTLRTAAHYKSKIDTLLAEHPSGTGFPGIEIDEKVGEGEMICISSLIHSKQLLVVGHDIPMNSGGFVGLDERSYKTRTLDKSQLKFDMRIMPLEGYTPGSPLNYPRPPPPRGRLLYPFSRRPNGLVTPEERMRFTAIPVWFDINGDLINLLWEMSLAAVLSIVVFRPGCEASVVEKLLVPCLEAWEIELLFEWFVAAGAAVWIGKGQRGILVNEGWWAVLGTDEDGDGDGDGDGGSVRKGKGKGKGKERAGAEHRW
ncbi:hypothetical protein MMC25_004859 [Agyrium rufum]|nr:hypothetical protein [Agyrium rufum]